MKKEDLFNAFGQIDDDLIENAEKIDGNKIIDFTNYKFRKILTVVASLIVIIAGGFMLPNILTQPQEDIYNSDLELRNSFMGTIESIDNITTAYIKPNEDGKLSEYQKLVVVMLDENHEFKVGDSITLYFGEISIDDEYINIPSFIIEKNY